MWHCYQYDNRTVKDFCSPRDCKNPVVSRSGSRGLTLRPGNMGMVRSVLNYIGEIHPRNGSPRSRTVQAWIFTRQRWPAILSVVSTPGGAPGRSGLDAAARTRTRRARLQWQPLRQEVVFVAATPTPPSMSAASAPAVVQRFSRSISKQAPNDGSPIARAALLGPSRGRGCRPYDPKWIGSIKIAASSNVARPHR